MTTEANSPKTQTTATNFIRQIIDEDNTSGKHGGKVATRFPPEPNGYLHIGHAKSICLNFGLARDYQGTCNLRFDDTNPLKEDTEYVSAIEEDVRWLGFQWSGRYFASDYFEKLYDFAVRLIELGKAYVDSQSIEEIRARRGSLTTPGQDSPYRHRTVAENLDLFKRMRAGEFPDGAHVLRAKIDMASGNINMRDPVIYRIRHTHHHRTGDKWCLYPMYDYAHPLSDMIEGITHSICTLEFADHRPFYDWLLETLKTPCHPQQIEFARLNINYTVMSKRKLLELVEQKLVSGWDDPRLPTIQGLRRRGYTPEALRDFCDQVGVTKKDSCIDFAQLENALRKDLDHRAPRAMAVLRPIKVVITNYPEGKTEELSVPNHPARPEMGTRLVPFGREIYIEADDFMEVPAPKYFRLAPGKEVRLRCAYYITCQEVIKDSAGRITELRCTYDPATKGGDSPDGRKVKGTIHWVSASHGIRSEVRLYDRLLKSEFAGDDFIKDLNPDSLEVLQNAIIEPALAQCAAETHFQFERTGYFVSDRKDHKAGIKPVFNRAVGLRDSWGQGK
jgi:glutaminyl-tRNA synthetase